MQRKAEPPWPWRRDDERLIYPFHEKLLRAGPYILCAHKGLFPPAIEQRLSHRLPYAKVDCVGRGSRRMDR